jgi:hypothetical protein
LRQGEQASDQCGVNRLRKKSAAAAAPLQQPFKRLKFGRIQDPVSVDES